MDFVLSQQSNRLFLQPISTSAQRYVDQFFPHDAKHWTDRKTSVSLVDLVDVLNGIQKNGLTIVGESNQSGEEGRTSVVLLIYLVTFVSTLILFVHGYHSLAVVLLFAVWAVLAFYLHRIGRP